MNNNHELAVAFATAFSMGSIAAIWGKIKRALKPRIKGEITLKIG